MLRGKWWLLALSIIAGCTSDSTQVITIWHFWSEPAQQVVLDELLQRYMREHPDVQIEATALAWSDGKQKLQLAFNAGTQPDIVHLGLDWFAEFHRAGVFSACSPVHADDTVVQGAGRLWVQNCRALLVHPSSPHRFELGIAVQDPHNVVKRSLPFLWEFGAPDFMLRMPISATMDDNLIRALTVLRDTVQAFGIAEPSRQLDDRWLRGEIHCLWTGPWMIPRAGTLHARVRPMRSIRNADVLAISRSTANRIHADSLTHWLASYAQARWFCQNISDAGVPIGSQVWTDTAFQQTSLHAGFLATLRQSVYLPINPRLLEIEPVVEAMIEAAVRSPSTEHLRAIVDNARRAVARIESDRSLE